MILQDDLSVYAGSSMRQRIIIMTKERFLSHLRALITVSIWGTTFIATKILLNSFSPVEIMMLRFTIGFLSLCVFFPKPLKVKGWKEEIYYLLAGCTGITFYYYLENTALTYTLAANVGIIIATVPFFTGIIAFFIYRDRTALRWQFFLGFICAFAGIVLISLNGSRFHMNPFGDFLTIIAALCWAFYSLIFRKIASFGYDTIQDTKRIFFWGTLLTIPLCIISGFSPEPASILEGRNLVLLLFLGVGACAICYILWNQAVDTLGPVQTNLYIYLNPVTTLIASTLILKEPVTRTSLSGTALILFGLILSQWRGR